MTTKLPFGVFIFAIFPASSADAPAAMASLLLQEVFRGTDEDEAAPVHGLEQIEFIALVGKHAVEDAVGKDAPQAG